MKNDRNPSCLDWMILTIVAVILTSCGRPRQERSIVDADAAKQAADAQLVQQANTGFPTWEEATLGEFYTFHDLKGIPSAYMFECEKQGDVVGYITVSASRRFTPIFESSTVDGLPVDRLDEAQALAEDHVAGEAMTEQLVFLGGLRYYVRYATEDGKQVFVDLSFTGLRIEDKQAMEAKQRSFERSGARNAEKAWNAVLTPTEP
jgi:hypothetical protein